MNDFHNNNNPGRKKIQECLILILGIVIAFSVEQPKKRMDIKDVATELQLKRERKKRKKEKKKRFLETTNRP